MPFVGNIFKCSSKDETNESKMEMLKEIEEGKAERRFMRQQLDEIKQDLDKVSLKAISIFGLDKDIAVMKRDLTYIQRDIEEVKQIVSSLKIEKYRQ